MKSFLQFLIEAPVNKHMIHLEENILELGSEGIAVTLRMLKSVGEKLSGKDSPNSSLTLKWDGAPAIFAGQHPETKKFFVGTKSIFNKEPKINYTNDDIDRNHGHAKVLADKLKVALKHLKPLGIKTILQGDMMFTKGDIKSKKIDGQDYEVFQPNTIAYAVPKGSDMAKEITSADLGVVFHTTYSGSSIDNLSASFGADVSKIKNSKSTWIQDAEMPSVSDNALWDSKETATYNSKIKKIESLIKKLDLKFLDELSKSSQMKLLVQTHVNSRIRTGQRITNPKAHMKDFYKWLETKSEKEIAKVKTQKTKDIKSANHKELINKLKKAEKDFILLYTIQSAMIDAKEMLVTQLEKIKGMQTFVQKSDGYEVTTPEGFVAIDTLTGGAVKLVDRLTFSRNNFNAASNFGNRS